MSRTVYIHLYTCVQVNVQLCTVTCTPVYSVIVQCTVHCSVQNQKLVYPGDQDMHLTLHLYTSTYSVQVYYGTVQGLYNGLP